MISTCVTYAFDQLRCLYCTSSKRFKLWRRARFSGSGQLHWCEWATDQPRDWYKEPSLFLKDSKSEKSPVSPKIPTRGNPNEKSIAVTQTRFIIQGHDVRMISTSNMLIYLSV